ncbi:MAG: sigma-70 family RNA polymerase sigma factor [Akkermansia sp.]|nr:sigma-70 family RNA polymerase sigma factor [Akkermansia sp.]
MTETSNKVRLRDLSDEELVAHLRVDCMSSPQIKEIAFNVLMRRYSRKIHTLILQMVRNEADAYDLSQISFLKIFRAIPFFRNNCKLFSWMYPIAVNTARDFIRARDRRRKNEGPSLDDEERLTEIIKYCSSNSANPYEALINVETQTILQAAVDELSESHREVIVLRHYMQMEYREISELLNVQEGTIRSRVHYAHEKLKDILKSSKKESLLKKICRKLFGGKKA